MVRKIKTKLISKKTLAGLANVVNDVKRICIGANILDDAIAIKETECRNARSIIENWI